MAQYEIKHTCGHLVVHNLYGALANRKARQHRLAKEQCKECRRQADLDKAREVTADLPDLIGSPKQIDWATSIRAKIVTRIDQLIIGKNYTSDSARQLVFAAANKIKNETQSKYWIDNRNETAIGLFVSAVKLLNADYPDAKLDW